MPRSKEELLAQGLPKWPQHLVTGKPVTIEQAKEVIRRTDTFFSSGYGGNNHRYDAWVRDTLGMTPEDKKYGPEAWEHDEKWRAKWGCISTEYVHNTWISCAFIGGPHGWMHPDGHIGFVDNVGKWPNCRDILEDWEKLATAFPFIEVGVTLMDCEGTEENPNPVISFRVADGKVEVVDPREVDVHKGHEGASRREGSGSARSSVPEFIANIQNPFREQGLSNEWIQEWAEKFGDGSPFAGPTAELPEKRAE
jgi:hypothetical protein